MTCEKTGCSNKPKYQVQYHDDWDFFDVCEEHLGESLIEEFEAQSVDRGKPLTFQVTFYESI